MSEAEESSSYPPIDPVNFDLIIIGTGLPESIIAAAASAVGKTILHLDPNSFYGSHFSSLSLEEITSYLNSPPKSTTVATSSSDDSDYAVINLIHQPLISDAELISCNSIDETTFLLENSRKFNLDLGGPRALFSADKTIDLLLKSDSRGAIFRDKKLSLKEKNQLMKFFKLVQQHLDDNEDGKISEEDMESPFVSFLEKTGLPPKIKAILLYAIAMVDYDQENGEVCKDLLATKDAIDLLAQYSSSVGRFPSAPGPLIYPIYGEGELPQAFCRRAAVKGCIYVLRMPVISLLMDKVTESYKGMVARGICITRSSIKPDVSNCSVVYPPRSLYPDQLTSVRALQIGSNLTVCPVGTFVLYFSTLCNDADEGKKLLKASMKALLTLPISGNTESTSIVQSDSEDKKAVVLWSAIYVQKLTTSEFEAISSTPTPDGNLNYNDLVDATEKLFSQMYPNEEFFPKTTSPEDSTDDGDNGIIMES
ncbi:unnamed protein product [Vicia faba]|uniref:Rab proteins geranylgeranyltransferase component n=1 Tax=Vicia faba TaxID=3906 RepID=A0AAV0YSM0_VICFA|nr:unnamed protein product [Vicia faba]